MTSPNPSRGSSLAGLHAVKGMNDILPEAIARWQRVERTFREISTRYGYREIRTPVVEPTQLFVRSIGGATDIVEKEMYSFVDKGEDWLTLRPEATAGCVRAYLEHAVYAREPITKWSYIGPMFRRERPARGRYRQFWQAGLECFGDPGPHVDAEMIDMVVAMLRELGVSDLEVLINSLGSAETRARYRAALTEYLMPHRDRLSVDSQRRLVSNPLRILDSKDANDREVCAGAPSLLDFLDESDRAHFDELQRTLLALGTPFRVEPRLVRGLDYYARTLFEVQGRGGELGAQNTLCGGGRYDGLVRSLGGPDVPSIGFAMGIERILLVMGGEDRPPTIDVAVVVADPALRIEATVLLRDLRSAGLVADADLRGPSLKSQLRRADKLGARLALLLGPAEIERGVVQLKDLKEHTTTEVPRAEVVGRTRAIVRESA
jgi:histidyl-tRNA synthetase